MQVGTFKCAQCGHVNSSATTTARATREEHTLHVPSHTNTSTGTVVPSLRPPVWVVGPESGVEPLGSTPTPSGSDPHAPPPIVVPPPVSEVTHPPVSHAPHESHTPASVVDSPVSTPTPSGSAPQAPPPSVVPPPVSGLTHPPVSHAMHESHVCGGGPPGASHAHPLTCAPPHSVGHPLVAPQLVVPSEAPPVRCHAPPPMGTHGHTHEVPTGGHTSPPTHTAPFEERIHPTNGIGDEPPPEKGARRPSSVQVSIKNKSLESLGLPPIVRDIPDLSKFKNVHRVWEVYMSHTGAPSNLSPHSAHPTPTDFLCEQSNQRFNLLTWDP